LGLTGFTLTNAKVATASQIIKPNDPLPGDLTNPPPTAGYPSPNGPTTGAPPLPGMSPSGATGSTVWIAVALVLVVMAVVNY
jgi:hypothetical protein